MVALALLPHRKTRCVSEYFSRLPQSKDVQLIGLIGDAKLPIGVKLVQVVVCLTVRLQRTSPGYTLN